MRLQISVVAICAGMTLLISPLSDACAKVAPAQTPRVVVKGKDLVDGSGKIIQLRGMNLSGLEFIAAQGWSPNDPWGNQYNSGIWKTMQNWNANAVRIPLNEASWLGYKCIDGNNKIVSPDPGGNYRKAVLNTISEATANGFFIIIDLHLSSPDDPTRAINGIKATCPLSQNPMPDVDHSKDFWLSIASTFKAYPNVIFELFNEPYFDWKAGFRNDWEVLRDGGTFKGYLNGMGFIDNHSWKAVGMQALLDAVRSTGSTNIVLVGGRNWAQRLDEWIKYKPKDPLNQLAAAWHAYPAYGAKWGTEKYTHPGFDDGYRWAEEILAAGIPVIITETGDRSTNGTVGAPFVSKVLPWADRLGISYLGWTFNVWPDKEDNVLLKDISGTPTDGFGLYFKMHLECVTQGRSSCP